MERNTIISPNTSPAGSSSPDATAGSSPHVADASSPAMPAAPSYVLQRGVSIIKRRVPFFILYMINASYSLWRRFFETVFGNKLWIRDHIEPSTAAATTRNDDVPEISAELKAEGDKDGDDASIRSADLPFDITEKILHCISPLESARLPFVCKSWAAIVSPRHASYPLVPHLFVTETIPRPPGPSGRDFRLRGYMVSVPLDGSARLPSPAIMRLEDLITRCSAKLIGATPDGRLALAMSRRVIFIDPVTDESKTLDVTSVPVFTGIAGDSSDTVLSHDDHYQTYYYRETTRLFRREHGSEEWSCGAVRDAPRYHSSGISSVANCGGVVFVLYRDGSMAKINTIARPPLVIEAVALIYNVPRPAWWRQDHDPRSSRDYLLESDGNVLFVRQQLFAQKPKMFPGDYWHYDTVGFEVHRLDVIGRRWVKVETLDGDRTLFVSTRSSFSVRASATAGCMTNCIYFVGESHHAGSCREREDCMSTWGVYSMEQRKVLFEHAVVVTERRTVARWFRPNVV